MSTPAANVVKIDWKQVCPWIILFQTFGLAFHTRQILVGSIAAAAIAVPHWYLLGNSLPYVYFGPDLGHSQRSVYLTLAPIMDLVRPLFHADGGFTMQRPTLTWPDFGRSVLLILWTLVVGSLAGGILSRRAAFEFAREESIGLGKTVRFVLNRTLDYLSAPLLPLCGVLAIGFLGLLTGWVARGIPHATSGLTAVWIVPLAFGVLAACLLFAVFAGWAMMVAAVSVNGGDGFDALSRGFGCVLDRWRYYTFCVLLLLAYGHVVLFIVLTALQWGDSLASASISLGLGALPHDSWQIGSANSPLRVVLSVLLTGFAYSFFWSGMTLTYLLIRKSIDNADLDSLYDNEKPIESDGLAALLKKNPVPETPLTLLPIIDLPGQ